jgi:RNA polymerase sigma-70 factor (ECF subfamily)
MTVGELLAASSGPFASAACGTTAERPSAPDREEEAWVSRARGGDHEAFGWLLSRYRNRAVRLAAHVLRCPGDAEDVAQEAFVLAFRNIRSYRGQGRFYTWLYAIVVRVCLERKRSARWRSEAPMDALPDAPAARTGTDERLLVEALLDRMTPPMRAALVLRELEGMEYEEIAQTLRIPVGTVRSRLNAARGQFRTLWQAILEETNHV